jgi:hypothetical protein
MPTFAKTWFKKRLINYYDCPLTYSNHSHLAEPKFHISTVWLGLRRVIALAEFIGLPQASATSGYSAEQQQKQKVAAEIWHNIWAVDRLVATMFNLPIATMAYSPPIGEVTDANGNVRVQNYFCRAANIAARLQELDNMQYNSQSTSLFADKVLKIDSDLRHLADMVPSTWWNLGNDRITADHVLQYWHQ